MSSRRGKAEEFEEQFEEEEEEEEYVETEPCVVCDEEFDVNELRIFKFKNIVKEGVCPVCLDFLKNKHLPKTSKKASSKASVVSKESSAPPPVIGSLTRKNLKKKAQPQHDDDDDEQMSVESGATNMSGEFSKFYCCEEKCRTKTGRIKFFYTNSRWTIHMLKEHGATLHYGQYLTMEHVICRLPHSEDDNTVVSLFGNLGL